MRAEREIKANKIANYLLKYEQNAKKLGKKLKADYFAMFVKYIDKLNALELQTKVGATFPKASYIKLPSLSELRLSKLKKIIDDQPELDF